LEDLCVWLCVKEWPCDPLESTKKRPYLHHGHVALKRALKTIGNQDGWIDKLGDVGEALKAWRSAIIHDLGGESAISAMELSVIELATKTHLLLASVDRFLLEQKSLINKSKRQLFPLVLQRQQLADTTGVWMMTRFKVSLCFSYWTFRPSCFGPPSPRWLELPSPGGCGLHYDCV
jgi:hypothetical protein